MDPRGRRHNAAMPLIALLPAVASVFFGAPQAQSYDIGEVDLFGQTGVDELKILRGLPVHAGDKISSDELSRIKGQIGAQVQLVVGKPPTDIAVVSFDDRGKTMIFVGVPGPTVATPAYRLAPTGPAALPPEGLKLYSDFSDRLLPAIQAGGGKEDDSQGYALFSDDKLHAIQLEMRAFAVANEKTVEEVLRSSSSAAQRQAAAMILGYAQHSRKQIESLSAAALDSDEVVRNNAIRALGVIAVSDQTMRATYPASQFIDLLRSGTWTDRNKGGWVIEVLTQGRDANLLKLVRKKALSSLIEMARWHNPGHAKPAMLILGRIAGIPEQRLADLADKHDVESVLAAL